MKPNQKSLIIKAARLRATVAATEQAATELSQFIDFIQHHNPDVDRAAATLTVAFCLHNLPAFCLSKPEMMQELSAIVTKFSQG